MIDPYFEPFPIPFKRNFPCEPLLEARDPKTMFVNEMVRKIKRTFAMSIINICFFFGLLYDIICECPRSSWFRCIEECGSLFIVFNIGFYVYNCISSLKKLKTYHLENNLSSDFRQGFNGMNNTFGMPNYYINKCHSNLTMNNAYAANYWDQYALSLQQKLNMLPLPVFPDSTGKAANFDQYCFNRYLQNFKNYEHMYHVKNNIVEQNTLRNVWKNAVSVNCTHSDFRRLEYQPASSILDNNNQDCKWLAINHSICGTDIWNKLGIDSKTLYQWTTNLRLWMSKTLIERIVQEIIIVNKQLLNFYTSDIQIGNIGLNVLKKTAKNNQIQQFIPSLSILSAFLSVTPNQTYLVRRLIDLSQGMYMTNYNWNGGGSYFGQLWNDNFVTDTQILLHVLITYLDNQLIEYPFNPEWQVFSNQHYMQPSASIPKSPSVLAIHQVSEKPPHFQLIVGNEIYHITKGYNNFFHTILLFLYFVSKKEYGMLSKVNMGKAGINIMWVIGQ